MAATDIVYFVSCVGQKRNIPTLAKDLYISDWFIKARHYAEKKGCPWFILSAEYGLVNPECIIKPYEKTLNTMPVAKRRQWAGQVAGEINQIMPQMKCAVFLAGNRYREFLASNLRSRGITIEVPMEGLRIGQQLSWLAQHQ